MLALARKYRPKSFGEVAVQTHVATTLKGAIARGRIAHGYLLCGPRGTGKTTLARVLAMALNCERKRDDGEPCGECPSCRSIWAGATSLDVVEIDAASNRGVDDARDLRERAMYAPSGDTRYKVYIVDEAHMLTREAWNALLKILEEPPPRVVFVFATTEPQRIAQSAAPVLSRLQRFDLKRIGPAEIRARLTSILQQEKVEAEPDALAMIARAADGSMRDALSLTDQVLAFGDARLTSDSVRSALGLVADDELLALLDLVAERRAADIFTASARLADAGADYGLLLSGFAEMLRAQMAIELGGVPPDVGERVRAALEERKGRLGSAELVRMMTVIVEHEPIFRKSAQPRMLFEALLVRFALLDRTIAVEDMLRALGGGGALPPPSGGGTGPVRQRAHSDVVPRAETTPPTLRDSAPPRAPAPVSASAPAPVSARALADTPVPAPAIRSRPLDVNRLAEFWDDIVAEQRAAGKALVAQLLEESTPSAVTSSGVVTLDAESDLTVNGLAQVESAVLDALKRRFDGVTKLAVRLAGAAPRRRYDANAVKAERTDTLRRDPLLAAAIDALDLELLE
ncbi:MAG TPA: DNA polymerase III subunit gamma/tau [Gemmatimonadaceae bacterium]|nr:DNA polymerase III subunit gamma/tau [Gemmatimonadaceae bacterium]